MRLTIITFLILFSYPSVAQVSFFKNADEFLNENVANGRVDYGRIKSNQDELKLLVDQIAAFDLKDQEPQTVKAFLINTYNLLVIKQVVDLYPIPGPLSVPNFFNGIKHEVGGKKMTLDQLEKGTLLKEFPDARIHFAVVCAAVGCPTIYEGAFTPENVENLLTERTRYTLNRNDFIKQTGKKIELSQIFNWYKKDFESKGSGLIDFINQYRDEPLPIDAKTTFYEYDWTLNDK
ncbi:MAG: DUF547 domain-containing protein [Cyclobacteriaceae bacterium]